MSVRRRRQVRHKGEIDRISSLPDDLLCDTLCCLPIKEAIATSLLSRRWKGVFARIPRLELVQDSSEPFIDFIKYVNNALQAFHESESIPIFRLKYAVRNGSIIGHYILDSMQFHSWVFFPVTRGVKRLELRVLVTEDSNPSPIFQCQTLEELKLRVNLDLELPMSLICLPNLKVLHLKVRSLDNVFITQLLSKCSSLEELYLNGEWKISNPITIIASPCLRRLELDMSYIQPARISCEFDFEVPNLEFLQLADVVALRYSFVRDLNSLVEANIKLLSSSTTSYEAILSLVRPLCNKIRMLCLPRGYIEALDNHCGSKHYKLNMMLHNLHHLSLECGWILQPEVLLELLNATPNLHTLSLIRGIHWENDLQRPKLMTESWSTIEMIPSCLEFRLKRIILSPVDDHEALEALEQGMIRYFLSSAYVLEELEVNVGQSMSLAEQIQLEAKLRQLSRSSPTCLIIFQMK